VARRPSPLSGAINRMRGEPEAQAPIPAPKPARVAKAKVRGIFLGGYVDETTKRQFKVLLAERGLTEQAALEEMLDDFFGKYGKHRIARRLSEVEG
jgi:ribosomal protein L20A (L18A)